MTGNEQQEPELASQHLDVDVLLVAMKLRTVRASAGNEEFWKVIRVFEISFNNNFYQGFSLREIEIFEDSTCTCEFGKLN